MSFQCVPGGWYGHMGVIVGWMVTMMKVGIFIFLAQILEGAARWRKVDIYYFLPLFFSELELWVAVKSSCHEIREVFVTLHIVLTFEKKERECLFLISAWNPGIRLTRNKYFRIFPTHHSESPLTFIFCVCIFSETIMKTFFKDSVVLLEILFT